MTPDHELLRRYTEQGDEAAFAEVVRRHLNLVYACALRLLNNDAALAQDVAQTVFTDLARKAARLRNHPTVAGWLHTSARFAASKAVRAEQSRRMREQEAAAMNETTTTDSCWTQLRPELDEAVGQLRETDRDALLLRYFEEKSHREIGEALGVSERAAQMRVDRALEKLRGKFSRRGVATTAALLATALEAHGASTVAPTALAKAVSTQSMAAAIPSAEILPTMLNNYARIRLGALAAILVLVVGIFVQHQISAKLPSAPPLSRRVPEIEHPKATAIVPTPQTPRETAATEDLGEIYLQVDRSNHTPGPNAYDPKTFTLKSGLTFSVEFMINNEDGSIMVKYGAFEANKPHWRLSIARDFLPPPISALNEDYQITATAGRPIMLPFANGEVVKFTPVFTPVKIGANNLGIITLTVGNPLKFTLPSGKVFHIERTNQVNLPSPLPGGFDASDIIGELKYSYEGRSGGGSGSRAIRRGEPSREIKQNVGDNEFVTFTPNYPTDETSPSQ